MLLGRTMLNIVIPRLIYLDNQVICKPMCKQVKARTVKGSIHLLTQCAYAECYVTGEEDDKSWPLGQY